MLNYFRLVLIFCKNTKKCWKTHIVLKIFWIIRKKMLNFATLLEEND